MTVDETLYADELIPSLGFFGSSDINSLSVKPDVLVYGIRLILGSAIAEIMNLRAIEVRNSGILIDLIPHIKKINLSSDYFERSEASALELLTGKGIHSKREVSPSWQIEFNSPLKIDLIQVSNRRDEWGRRSSSLKIMIKENDESWTEVYSGHSPNRVCKVINDVLLISRFIDCSGVKNPGEVKLKLINSISQNLRAGTISITDSKWESAIQLTRIWDPDELSEQEWDIISAKILFDKIISKKSDLSDYAFILATKRKILLLKDAINRVAIPSGLGRFGITRHGLQSAKLETHRDAFMLLLEDVLQHLEEKSLEPFISYGTLLGAKREGKFISHDDDVDVVYLLQGVTEDERLQEMDNLFSSLQNTGHLVNRSKGGMNAHVFGKGRDIVIDIFPCWIQDSRLFLHMENMVIRDIPADMVYPRSKIILNDCTMPAPCNVDDFLQERYGDGWQVSDPYFEWHWKLKED